MYWTTLSYFTVFHFSKDHCNIAESQAHFIVLQFSVLYCGSLYCTVSHFILLQFTILYYSSLYFTVVHCILLQFTVFYCSSLYFTAVFYINFNCILLQFPVFYCTLGEGSSQLWGQEANDPELPHGHPGTGVYCYSLQG